MVKIMEYFSSLFSILFVGIALIQKVVAQGELSSIVEDIGTVYKDLGDTASFSCVVGNYIPGNSTVQWFHFKPYVHISNDEKVIPEGNKYSIAVSGPERTRTTTLTINNLDKNDVGLYRCRVSISRVPYTLWPKRDGNLFLQETPSFVNGLKTDNNADLGGSVTMTCRANGKPEPRYTWYKAGIDRPMGHGEQLMLAKVEQGHAGTYICSADNGVGKITLNYTLIVEFGPLCSFNDGGDIGQVPGIGESMAHTCLVQGYPLPEGVKWYRMVGQGKLNAFQSDRSSTAVVKDQARNLLIATLTIHNVTTTDFGTYVCEGVHAEKSCKSNFRFYEKRRDTSATDHGHGHEETGTGGHGHEADHTHDAGSTIGGMDDGHGGHGGDHGDSDDHHHHGDENGGKSLSPSIIITMIILLLGNIK